MSDLGDVLAIPDPIPEPHIQQLRDRLAAWLNEQPETHNYEAENVEIEPDGGIVIGTEWNHELVFVTVSPA